MGQQAKRGEVVNRFNVSVGDKVIFRGKHYEVDEVSHAGVWLKSDRKGVTREFIYLYEAEKFQVVFV